MDYKEKYKFALERARKIHNDTEFNYEKGMMEEVFPELAESEDEKIRKEFCEDIWTFIPNEKAHKYIAWLEKQGEQETDEWKEGNIIRHGGALALVIKGRRAMKSNGEIFTVQYPDEWVKAAPNEIEHFLNELEKQVASIDVDFILNKVSIKPAYKDGNAWCILYGDNIQDGICGFGDTKEDALVEFIKELLE